MPLDASSVMSLFGGGLSGGVAGGIAGGGGGYGAGPTSVASGGTNKAAFGSVNFGAGAKVGGTSTSDGDAGTGASVKSNGIIYITLGILGLVVVVLLFRR